MTTLPGTSPARTPEAPVTMRAWRVTGPGEPADVLRLDEVPAPQPGPGEVLVRVRAVAVNFPDVLLARGEYQVRPEPPFVPGIELCGDVVALGDGVAAGERGLVPGARVVGSAIGVLSELAVLPAAAVHPAPDDLDDADSHGHAAASHLGGYGPPGTAVYGAHQVYCADPERKGSQDHLLHIIVSQVGGNSIECTRGAVTKPLIK